MAAIWTGYDQPERIYTSGNPAARIYKTIMRPVHEGLAWKDFPWPYIGGDTGIFGQLAIEEEPAEEFIIEGGGDDYVPSDEPAPVVPDSPGGGDGGGDGGDDEIVIIG